MAAQVADHGNRLPVDRVGRLVRDEAEVQAHGVDAQQSGEVGDFLHLLQPRRAGLRRNEAHRSLDRGNIGVALALETAENNADLHPKAGYAGEELAGLLGRAVRGARGMELDRRHAQLVGHVEMNSQTGIDAGKDS